MARLLAELVRENVTRDPACRARFEALRGSFALVTDDGGPALTLRFDFGRLVIHLGVVGVPDVTLRGSTPALQGFVEHPGPSLLGLALGTILRRAPVVLPATTPSGSLKIYGLLTHPFQVRALLGVLSRGG